jgi:hypothetical protein
VNDFFNSSDPSGRTRDSRAQSPFHRNYYEKQKNYFWGVERGRWVGLTTLPPSVSRLSRQCRILNISQPYRPSRPITGTALVLYKMLFRLSIYISRFFRLFCINLIRFLHFLLCYSSPGTSPSCTRSCRSFPSL